MKYSQKPLVIFAFCKKCKSLQILISIKIRFKAKILMFHKKKTSIQIHNKYKFNVTKESNPNLNIKSKIGKFSVFSSSSKCCVML